MEPVNSTSDESSFPDEETIFKSLTHQVRRHVIKLFKERQALAFSDIQKGLEPIDSPNLAYHLKNMQALVTQLEGKYSLTPIGIAALNLLSKVDQDTRIKWYRRKFFYAHMITIFCWIAVEALAPLIYNTVVSPWTFTIIMIIINVAAAINQVALHFLNRYS
jgi:hypothetical protein